VGRKRKGIGGEVVMKGGERKRKGVDWGVGERNSGWGGGGGRFWEGGEGVEG